MSARRKKRNEIKDLYKMLAKANERALYLTTVKEVREHLQRAAEIRMRITILEGELHY